MSRKSNQQTRYLLVSILGSLLLLGAADQRKTQRTASPSQDPGARVGSIGTDQPTAANLVNRKQYSGGSMKMEMDNSGAIGYVTYPPRSGAPRDINHIGLEYPIGESIEHIYGGGIWVGAQVDSLIGGTYQKVKLVSCAYEGYGGGINALFEFSPGPNAADSFWTASRGNTVKPAGWDEYWGSNFPFNPISDHDMYCMYTDDQFSALNHTPMHLKVLQKSYAWQDPYAEAILINEYQIINTGPRPLDSVFIGFFVDGDVGPVAVNLFERNNFTGYYPDAKTAYIHNPLDRGSTPFGATLLWANGRDLTGLRYTFQWYPLAQSPITDQAKYDMMASGVQRGDEYPALSDTRFLFAFGRPWRVQPFTDTLKIAMAFVSGKSRTRDPRIVMQLNATRALDIYLNQGIRLPFTPPSPPLRAEVGDRKVTLDWKWRPGDDIVFHRPELATDPELNWDSTSKVAQRDPLRRSNPPSWADSTKGGRNFEAYLIWKSYDPNYPDDSFTLLKQVDVKVPPGYPDSLSFEYDTGLEYTYVDSNLTRGRTYVYAVTSKSIPNLTERRNPDSTITYVPVEPLESSKLVNAVPIGKDKQLPFSTSSQLGKVSVVPNPYRTDQNYTYENAGFEGRASVWDENDRKVKFINLPAKCTIRIFSLAGDLVRTVEHDGNVGTAFPFGDENVPLVSESNRALASGIYLYTVESDLGVQTGKFVIIR
ncbi:MAG TPA: hypothetical protein DGH68_06515 [Bacteroidetes bacterium]|jgi:hypothetical protein|nr:hypothetical protein [Bacteroidota bacterium]